MNWISVKERLPKPGKRVIFFLRNRLGNGRTLLGIHAPKFTIECHGDEDDGDSDEYCEEKDIYYRREGWYEEPYESDYYYFVSDIVTHWAEIEPPDDPLQREQMRGEENSA
jgi:hypothetical protein